MDKLIQKAKQFFLKKSKASDVKKSAIRPFYDWLILFSLTIVAFIAIVAVAIFIFIFVKRGEFTLNDTTGGIENKNTVQIDRLVKALTEFKARQDEFDARKEERPTISDPSI